MLAKIGDIWTIGADFVVVPTNTMRTKQGWAVMGGGVAAQAAARFPALPRQYGKHLSYFGDLPFVFFDGNVVCVPTKKDWREPSTPALVCTAVTRLCELSARMCGTYSFALPLLGGGLGGLSRTTVLRELEALPDNFWLVELP